MTMTVVALLVALGANPPLPEQVSPAPPGADADPAAPARASDPVPDGSIRLVFSGDTFGFSGRSQVPGGFARRATALRQLRAQGPVLLFDTGNALGPLYYARFDRGAFSSQLLNDLGYDGINIGVHELDYGVTRLRELEERYRLPLISSNLVDPDGGHPFATHRIIERHGVRVGVVGLINPNARHEVLLGRLDPLQVQPWEPAIEAALAEIRDRVDLRVLVSDAPHAVTRRVARRFPELDVVVGPGLDPNERPFDHDDESPFQVLTLRHPPDGHRQTLLTMPRRYGHAITIVRAIPTAAGPWRLDAYEHALPVEAPEDPQLAALLTVNAGTIKEALGDVIVDDAKTAFGGELTAGRLLETILLALRDRAGTGLAVINDASLSNLDYSVRQVNARNRLLAYDLERLIWADNHLVILTLTGAQLQELLRTGEDLHFLGAELTDAGPRVRGRPIRDDEVYNVATTDYLVSEDGPVDVMRQGHFWYRAFSPEAPEPILIRDVVADTLTRAVPGSPPAYPAEWRIHFDDWRADLSRLSTARRGDASGVRDARVQAVDLDAVQASGRFAITLDTEDWVWTTDASTRFVRIEIDDSVVNNPEDQVRAGTEIIARGLTWATLEPIMSATYETELTAPEGLRRLQRLRGFVGVQTDLGGWVDALRIGPIVETDVSAATNVAAGGFASVRLERALIGRLAATVRGEGRFLPSYQTVRPDSVRWIGQLEVGLKVPVYGNFFVTPRVGLFGYELAQRPRASGNNLLVGIGISYDRVYKPQTQTLLGSW